MRVGIDARRYDRAGRGQERYIRCLIRALAATRSRHEFVLLGRPDALRDAEPGDGMRIGRADRTLRLQYRRRFVTVRRLLVRGFDLVHFTLADGWYRPPIQSVVTIHDLSVLRFPRAYFPNAQAEQRARRHHLEVTAGAAAVIVGSDSTRRDVHDLLDVPAERVAVIPHGLDPIFRPVNDPAILNRVHERYALRPPYLLFVGGADFKKNLTRLIDAYAIARSVGGLDHALVLVGPMQNPENPYYQAARSRAVEHEISDCLRWIGFVPDDDLPPLYSGADAFVFPSLMEGFGFPVLEAMACGTPVVTSQGSAMAEVTGPAAVLVDPFDAGSMARGILDVLDGRGKALASAALERARRFTWGNSAASTLEVYERAVEGIPVSAEVSA